MKAISPEKIVIIGAGICMLASLGFLIADIGFGFEGLRSWSAISFAVAAVIMALPLLLLAIMLVIERVRPNKAEQDGAGQPPTRPESK
jgi:hypothetical protein